MQATDGTTPRGFTLPLALRFFLATALLIALALGAAVFVTYTQGQRIAADALDKAVATSDAVQREFEQHRLETLQSNARLVAADSAFARYIGSAAGGGALPGVETQSGPDLRSMRDLLLERQREFGFDLGVLLDGQGNTLARTDRAEAVEESLAMDPLVAAALKDTPPVAGYWRQRDRLYQAAIMPVVQDNDLLGYLLLAQGVDDTLAQKVAQASGAQVAFRIPAAGKAALAASSLDATAAPELGQAIAALDSTQRAALDSGRALDQFHVRFANQEWVGRSRPMGASGDAKLGSVLVLASADRFVSGYRMILNWVLLAGLVSMVAALLLSLLLSKRILSPVRSMALAAEEAPGGNYQARIDSGGSDELGRLSRAFDTLLSELREKSDMEGYVGHLARFLPEPTGEVITDAPTRKRASANELAVRRTRATLLGAEFRHLLADKPDAPVQQVATESVALKARLDELARSWNAQLHVAEGARWFFSFEGDAAHARALACWQALLAMATTQQHPAPCGAISDGELLHDGEFLLGMAQAQVHRLLCDAAAGQLLTLAAFADALAREQGEVAVQTITGAYSTKPRAAVLATAWERGAKEAASISGQTVVLGTARSAVAAPPARTAAAALGISPGSVLGNRYRIVSVLGEGGMGVVYKAHDLELDDLVALKMVKPGALADGSQLERLKDEIKLARRITHPNVLRTFDFGEIGGMPYISMEYVRGLTLRYLLRDAKRVPYSAGLRVARQLAAGLGAAHAVGVLHRDIKPENLILEANANAKLMDFGIARPTARMQPGNTEPGTFLGTPNYCAPEQLAGEEIDERADLYSCGVLMTEMFCGGLPYSGKSTMDIYIAQMQDEPKRPSTLWPEIPADLEAIILRCLRRVPGERFGSAGELGAALARLRV
jgi:serine/threonine-protein kinase